MNSHFVDEISKLPCLIDTGSSVSIFPDFNNHFYPISWYNSTTSTINKTIKIGSNYYSWTFRVANINQIILGSDFLQHYNISLEFTSTI